MTKGGMRDETMRLEIELYLSSKKQTRCKSRGCVVVVGMDARGNVTLDKQIEMLTNREKLPEDDIKALCAKVCILLLYIDSPL